MSIAFSTINRGDPEVYSFTNNPLIQSIGWHIDNSSTSPMWQLSFSAVFTNSCVADQGVEVYYVDVASSAARQLTKPTGNKRDSVNDVRVIWLEQQYNLSGCPEIYSPVSKNYLINLPTNPAITTLKLLDYTGSAQDLTNNPLQLLTVPVTSSSTSANFNTSATALSVLPFLTSGYVPLVTQADFTVSNSDTGGFRVVGLELTLESEFHCAKNHDPKIKFFESRTGVSDTTGADVIDWLLITNPGHDCEKTATPIYSKLRIKKQITTDYNRSLVIMNYTSRANTGQTRVFTQIPIVQRKR